MLFLCAVLSSSLQTANALPPVESFFENNAFGGGERQLSWPVDDNYLGRFAT